MKGNFKNNWTWLIFFLYCGWLILDFILDFPWLIFLVGVSFANYCYLLHSFFKKSQNCNDNNFCILSNLFHHKHINNNFSMKNKEQVSLRNQFPWETSFSARQVSLGNQFLCKTSFPAKLVLLRNQFICEISFPVYNH